MKLQRKKETKINTYLTTAAVICSLFLLLCVAKQIYPFGNNTIDTVDCASQWVPAYYHVWDFLHGRGSLLFDWKVAGGMNCAGVSSQFSLLSPFNLLLLLVKRSQIQKFMTVFVLAKLVAMGLSMCFFLQKRENRDMPILLLVAGSVAYALSGYTFQYYGMGWTDVAVLFPLLIHNFLGMAKWENHVKQGKYGIGYIICLTLIFVINIPQAYMSCFFLILFAGGYFFLLREKTISSASEKINRGGILKFGLNSLLSLGLSAVVFLPAALEMLNSSRLSEEDYTGENSYFWLLRQPGMDCQAKWMMLLGVAIPFCYLLVTTRKSIVLRKNSKNRCLWQSYLVVVMILPVVVEAVNLMWHRGTYMCFPMRYGYMMIFAILAMAAERYMENRQSMEVLSEAAKKRRRIFAGTLLAAWCGLTMILGLTLLDANVHVGTTDLVRDSQEIGVALGDESDVFHKVKVEDASLDSNYPLIARVASYSNYLHLMTEEQIAMSRAFGYSQIWTRLSDTGGTLFSDALLGYDYIVSNKQTKTVNTTKTELWEKSEETEHFEIFQNNYVYGLGLRLDLEAYRQLDQTILNNVFENQNKLSKALFGETFFNVWEETFLDEKASETLTYRIPIEEKGILYLYTKELGGAEIFVNGESLAVPSYADLQGTKYISDYNNGILMLGCFVDEEVEVEIHQTCYDTKIPKQIQFAVLDMAAFADSVEKNKADTVTYVLDKNSCKLSVTAEQEEFLLLPINADDGWHCTINGGEEGFAKLYGNLMLIQLKEGENEIILKYMPRGYRKGAASSLLAVIVLLCWLVLPKIKRLQKVTALVYEGISYVALAVFFIVFIGFLIVVYVIPICYTIYWKMFGVL
jgi:uncharacterized membrane protein YfhO